MEAAMEALYFFAMFMLAVGGFVFTQVWFHFWDQKDQQRAYEQARENERRRMARPPRFGG